VGFILFSNKKEPVKLFTGSCREDRIRTCDPVVPNHVFYRAELPPELSSKNLFVLFLATLAPRPPYSTGLNYFPNFERTAKIDAFS
jgi:hypothetical protein